MKALLWRCVPSFIHLILCLVLFEALLANFDQVLVPGCFLLVLVHALATVMVSKGEWKQLVISIFSFFCFVVVYFSLIKPLGHPAPIDDPPGNGIILLFYGVPISLISLFFGTMFGIVGVKIWRQLKDWRTIC